MKNEDQEAMKQAPLRGDAIFQEVFETITRPGVKSWQMSITETIGRKRKQ
jgi:hypothetical protein